MARGTALGALGLLLAGGPGLGQTPPTLDTFFRPAVVAGSDLPADGLYPRGRQLLFSLYSVQGRLGDWTFPGFSAVGPFYGDQLSGGQYAPHANVMDVARALGVKCFYRLGLPIPFLKEHVTPPDEEIAAAIAEQVRAVADRPEIGVWYITPEELRYWRADEMRYLKAATDAIRANDPLGRPIMMYEPNNRGAEALAKTLPNLDFSSRGMYANTAGFKDCRGWIRWCVEQELAAIAEVKPAATPVSVLWMAGDPDPAERELIPRWCRHDVYLSLVTGAKGIVIWSGFRRAGFTTYDDYFTGYASAAYELNGPLDLARVFLCGERRDDVQVEVVSGPATQSVTRGETTSTFPTISHLAAAVGEERYLFLVNSATEPVTVKVTGLPAEGFVVRDLFADGEAQPAKGGDWERLELPALEVRGWRLCRG